MSLIFSPCPVNSQNSKFCTNIWTVAAQDCTEQKSGSLMGGTRTDRQQRRQRDLALFHPRTRGGSSAPSSLRRPGPRPPAAGGGAFPEPHPSGPASERGSHGESAAEPWVQGPPCALLPGQVTPFSCQNLLFGRSFLRSRGGPDLQCTRSKASALVPGGTQEHGFGDAAFSTRVRPLSGRLWAEGEMSLLGDSRPSHPLTSPDTCPCQGREGRVRGTGWLDHHPSRLSMVHEPELLATTSHHFLLFSAERDQVIAFSRPCSCLASFHL